MMNVDTTGWTLIEEGSTGPYYWIQPGIVAGIPYDQTRATLEQSTETHAAFVRFTAAAGFPIGLVAVMDRFGDVSEEVTSFWLERFKPDLVSAIALVTNTLFGQAVSALLLGPRQPPVPIQVFNSPEPAITWMQARVETWRKR